MSSFLEGTAFLLFLMSTRPAAAGAEMSAPPYSSQIIDGFEVEPCAWPSAVYLKDSDSACSGVHVGGRIVLTAAHCVDHNYDTEIPCAVDEDCPKVDDFGNSLDLSCNTSSVCSSAASLVVNKPPIILFGERYPNFDEHPRRAIPAEYCRSRSLGTGVENDFAYCVLSEDPVVQPVPMVMHCEVDQLLTAGTALVAVGFGGEEMADLAPKGTKHYILTSLAFDASSAGDISLTDWVGQSPSAGIWKGDSGGPLFAQLPDGTWRVIGLASRAPVFYERVWPHVEWMLEDANVAAERDKIIPCHTQAGGLGPHGGLRPISAEPRSAERRLDAGPIRVP